MPENPAPAGCDIDLYRFFSSLPDKLRVPMVLYYLEGYDVRTIASMLRLPEGTVKARLKRGRDKMKQDDALKEVQGL